MTYAFRETKKKAPLLQGGFSLIELMVSLTIFSMVMVVSVGTLLIMVDLNAKAQALYSSSTNLSFALDSLTREIRTGYNYYCYTTNTASEGDALPTQSNVRDCTNENSVAFTREKDGWQVGYRLNISNMALEQKINNPTGSNGDTNWSRITSRDVEIDSFKLVVKNSARPSGPSSGDFNQPTVDIFVKGSVSNGLDTDTNFSIQSHIIQRRFDAI